MFNGYELAAEECAHLGRILMTAQRVLQRHQFFAWVHGPVQALVPHEILLCGLIDARGNVQHEFFSACRYFGEAQHRLAVRPNTGLISSLSQEWLSVGETRFIDGARRDENVWAGRLAHLELKNIAFHGLRWPGGIMAYAGFSRLRVPMDDRLSLYLALLLPQLAAALARVLAFEAGRPGIRRQGIVGLTVREIEVLDWVKAGKTNGEIADILGLSMLTVKNHVRHAMKKLVVCTRGQAVARSIALGYLQA